MPVGHVLPMGGQGAAERKQLRTLELFDPRQHLIFGVGSFQGQIEVVEQVAEQATIEQAQGRAWLTLPELFGVGGDIVGQGVAVQIQAEGLLRHGPFCPGGQGRTAADERLQKIAIAPDQPAKRSDQCAPQQYFDDRGQGVEVLAIQPTQQGFEPLRGFPGLFFFGGVCRVIAKAVTGDGFRVFEGWLFEQCLDAVA